MPINAGVEYQLAEKKFGEAQTTSEKLATLHEMLRTAPKHKSSEKLQQEIKNRISKYKKLQQKEKKQKKGSGGALSIKKEGAATVCIVGLTNTGKSTLLNKLTNANAQIATYPFTTKKPEIGTIDYKGIKIQLIEIPAIVENFMRAPLGPQFLGIIRLADLLIITGKPKIVLDELNKADINKKYVIYRDQENIADIIWEKLGLIKVYTKEPGKEPKYPPLDLEKGATVKDAAEKIHKDFVKKFRYARIWGKSVKFNGTSVGLDHVLKDNDIVELHIK